MKPPEDNLHHCEPREDYQYAKEAQEDASQHGEFQNLGSSTRISHNQNPTPSSPALIPHQYSILLPFCSENVQTLRKVK